MIDAVHQRRKSSGEGNSRAAPTFEGREISWDAVKSWNLSYRLRLRHPLSPGVREGGEARRRRDA